MNTMDKIEIVHGNYKMPGADGSGTGGKAEKNIWETVIKRDFNDEKTLERGKFGFDLQTGRED